MRVNPFFANPHISLPEVEQYECSDFIMLPRNIFEEYHYDVHTTLFLTIVNTVGESISGVVKSVHDINDVIYVPTWMWSNLSVTHNVSLTSLTQHPCTHIALRPYNNGFRDIKDWENKLSFALRNYATLTAARKNCSIYILMTNFLLDLIQLI